MNDNNVFCWGFNVYGQVENGSQIAQLSPTRISVDSSGVGIKLIITGDYHTYALMNADIMSCWGRNSRGQIVDGTTTNRLTSVFHFLTFTFKPSSSLSVSRMPILIPSEAKIILQSSIVSSLPSGSPSTTPSLSQTPFMELPESTFFWKVTRYAGNTIMYIPSRNVIYPLITIPYYISNR